MPSIWVILAGAVGALNVRLMTPVVAAFFGIGKWRHPTARRLTT